MLDILLSLETSATSLLKLLFFPVRRTSWCRDGWIAWRIEPRGIKKWEPSIFMSSFTSSRAESRGRTFPAHNQVLHTETHSGVALITGASRGIGRAVALRLAKDGYDIALNDLRANSKHIDSVKEEISRIGRRACVVPADVKHEKEVVGMVDETVKALGSLNVMVANAGIVQYGSILDTSTELWDEVLAINGRGVFLCYKYAAKQMIAQGSGGRIIGASSVSGKQGGALQGAYCASKFAVRGLTQSVARELAPHGITVNAYSPGPISTAMMGRVHELSGTPDEKYQLEVEATPLKRYGKPEEVAALVSFLASDGAAYITGQSVSINGGRFCD